MSGPAKDLGVVTLLTRVATQPEHYAACASWLVSLMMTGSKFPGFVNAEILPPASQPKAEWLLEQNFRKEHLDAWKESASRRKVLDELPTYFPPESVSMSEEVVSQTESKGNVATAIVTQVKPGGEDLYREWETKLQIAQASYPGFRGASILPPTAGTQGLWTTLLRFDTPESLDKWFTSEERTALLPQGKEFVQSTEFHRYETSFAGWFPTDSKTGQSPPNWKTSWLVLIGLYPIVMLEIRFLNPLLHGLFPALATFIGILISVAGTTWITIPLAIKLFHSWLFAPAEDVSANIKGLIAVVCICVAEIVLLGNLL